MVRPVSYVVIAFIIAAASLIAMLLMRNLRSGSAEQVTYMQLSKHDQHEATEMTEVAVKGKELFTAKCASCHALFKSDGDMMQVKGFTSREPWTNRQHVYAWFRNPDSFAAKNDYKARMRESFGGTRMPAYPELSDAAIDAVVAYLEYAAAISR